MSEKPDTIHGRLLEAVHISGYSFERAYSELEWLLDEDRWKLCGDGYEDIDEFLATINFSEFRVAIKKRKTLAKKLADIDASQRAIAGVFGVNQSTIHEDLSDGNPSKSKQKTSITEDAVGAFDGNPSKSEAPSPYISQSGEEVGKAAAIAAGHEASGFYQDTIATKWTGDQESYTPAKYIEAARGVMGSIDLDPASNDIAQKTVRAGIYYTRDDDGLKKPWGGNVFLNPPYSYPDIENFINKLLSELDDGQQAILLTNNNTDTAWFHCAAKRASAICFTRGRINFYKGDGSVTSPTNGQTFFYFGKNRDNFIQVFAEFGVIMVTA